MSCSTYAACARHSLSAKMTTGSLRVSARSLGGINVQLIMEKLGGGGNRSAAAVQFQQGETLKDAVSKIYAAIDDYFA